MRACEREPSTWRFHPLCQVCENSSPKSLLLWTKIHKFEHSIIRIMNRDYELLRPKVSLITTPPITLEADIVLYVVPNFIRLILLKGRDQMIFFF